MNNIIYTIICIVNVLRVQSFDFFYEFSSNYVFIATNPKVGVRMDENQLQILDDLPSSAVEMQVKDKVCQ